MTKKLIAFHLQKLVLNEKNKLMNQERQYLSGQQKFDLHDILNLIEIEINDDMMLNTTWTQNKIFVGKCIIY